MKEQLHLGSLRSRKARLARRFGNNIEKLLFTYSALGTISGGALIYLRIERIGFLVLATAILCLIVSLWYRYELKNIPPNNKAEFLDDVMEPHFLSLIDKNATPRSVWQSAAKTTEGRFVLNHLLIDSRSLSSIISDKPHDLNIIWYESAKLYDKVKPHQLHAGIVVIAIILNSPVIKQYLTDRKLHIEETGEVLNWLERQLAYIRVPKPYFGGIGRDWASGYTPTLESFSHNISESVERSGGAHFIAHTELMDSIVASLSRNNAVALVGEDGVGKSSLVLGLAQRLLEAKDPALQYHQIVSLNAAQIVSFSGAQLEKLLITIFSEAVAAGNIILFLDDAELFFGKGVGAFDMSQLLMPLLKNRNIHIITSLTPAFWQQLRGQYPALANGMTAITVKEPSENTIYKIVEDTALIYEYHNKLIISYEAVREAYRLSGQYMQDQAYPAKAERLLEQSMAYADGNAVTADSVKTALERIKGIKVSSAQAPEADMLLNLEDKIHERMINQVHAVGAVAAALRRGRAGVANPKRPVGSFLFLGPTGVGKTELARSLAAIYFGDEKQVIRLDMSEYQQPSDVKRILSSGGTNERGLLLNIREQPFSVVLLDEIEKAHPNILNLMLQMLDEGQLTDEQGRMASFRSSIIIATSNAGAADISQRVREQGSLDGFDRILIDKLIGNGQFKPELVNRFDEVVLFRPLNQDEMGQVAKLMLAEVNKTLANQQITVDLTQEALQKVANAGYDPEFGARPMRRAIQRMVEDTIAKKILRSEAKAGDHITLDATDLD